jgi:hypothetical protein
MTKRDMKLYGYANSNDMLLDLREVTVHVDADTAQQLGEFFLRCAQGMRATSSWEHEHFDGGSSPDVVVFNSKVRAVAKTDSR